MVVRIIPKFTAAQIKGMLAAKVEAIHNAYYDELEQIGEAFVKRARENDTYKDRTGNLRNSIGYIIFKDGEQVTENFQKASKAAGADGVATGKQKATEFSKRYPKGWTLVCVAGMNYAAAVESKGFDVISGSSIEAKNELRDAVYEIYKEVQGK